MSAKLSPLRFNFGFLTEASLGTSREIELHYPQVKLGEDVVLKPLEGKFEATRTSRGIYLRGTLHAAMVTECARCLTEFWQPIEVELDDLFHLEGTAPEGEFEIGQDGFLDLAPLLRELSFLALPIQPCCRESCLGMCSHCGQNLNEGSCDCDTDDIDPRLAALKLLLDRDNSD